MSKTLQKKECRKWYSFFCYNGRRKRNAGYNRSLWDTAKRCGTRAGACVMSATYGQSLQGDSRGGMAGLYFSLAFGRIFSGKLYRGEICRRTAGGGLFYRSAQWSFKERSIRAAIWSLPQFCAFEKRGRSALQYFAGIREISGMLWQKACLYVYASCAGVHALWDSGTYCRGASCIYVYGKTAGTKRGSCGSWADVRCRADAWYWKIRMPSGGGKESSLSALLLYISVLPESSSGNDWRHCLESFCLGSGTGESVSGESAFDLCGFSGEKCLWQKQKRADSFLESGWSVWSDFK